MELGDWDYADYSGADSFLNYSLWNATDSDSDWCEAGEQEFTIKMFQTCAFCLIFVLGLAGNGLVIATFAAYGCARLRSTTDIFLFHLALADLLLLLTLPLQAVDTHLGWVLPAALCKLTRATYAVNTYSGLLLLACISVDRYLVVARAREMLRLRRWMLAVGTAAAVGVWMVAALLSLPEILFSGVTEAGSEKHCGLLRSGGVKLAANGAIIAVFGLSLFVMVLCYSLIARVLCEGEAHRRGRQWRRQRTLRLMLCLVLVFLLLQLPYTVVLSRAMAGRFCGPLPEYVTRTLAYARCAINPILYALVGVRFRSDVIQLLHDCGCPCGLPAAPQRASSASPSSPAPTVLSSGPPTSPKGFNFPSTSTKPQRSNY